CSPRPTPRSASIRTRQSSSATSSSSTTARRRACVRDIVGRMPGGGTTPRQSEARADERISSSSTAVHGEAQPSRPDGLLVSESQVASYPLPDTGEVRIGRSPQCEVLIDDASVSRVHATLTVGPVLFVRDRGSVNGTRVREQRLAAEQAVEIAP